MENQGATRVGTRTIVTDPGRLQGLSGVEPLGLDLPAQAAWKTADCLLQEGDCPPLILLTARSGQFDLSRAIRAGSLIDKTTSPTHLLAVVDQTLTGPCSAQAERNALQRVMIRWLKPCGWSAPVTPAYRF